MIKAWARLDKLAATVSWVGRVCWSIVAAHGAVSRWGCVGPITGPALVPSSPPFPHPWRGNSKGRLALRSFFLPLSFHVTIGYSCEVFGPWLLCGIRKVWTSGFQICEQETPLVKQKLYTGTHLQALRCRGGVCQVIQMWGGGQVYMWGHRTVIMQKCKSSIAPSFDF